MDTTYLIQWAGSLGSTRKSLLFRVHLKVVESIRFATFLQNKLLVSPFAIAAWIELVKVKCGLTVKYPISKVLANTA